LSSIEISDNSNLREIINKVDDVNKVLSLLSTEEIELANKISDKSEDLKTSLGKLDTLVKDDFSSFIDTISNLNESINKVLRDAIEMELMFQTKLDSFRDKKI
jgi:predicted transcriptional regulator